MGMNKIANMFSRIVKSSEFISTVIIHLYLLKVKKTNTCRQFFLTRIIYYVLGIAISHYGLRWLTIAFPLYLGLCYSSSNETTQSYKEYFSVCQE